MNVTKSPKYSVSRLSNGRTMVRYTAEINGRPVISEYVSNSPGEALSGAKSRFDKTIRNRYDISSNENIDNLLGPAKRQDAATEAFQAFTGEPINQNLDDETISFLGAMAETISGDNLSEEEEEAIAKDRIRAENKDEIDAGVMIKGKPQNHVPYQKVQKTKYIYDGNAGRPLKEPHPRYFERPGDRILENSNNARIVLGRDFAPDNNLIYSKNTTDRKVNSGYSSHMGAGAIDMVVGMMAPFPIQDIGKDYSKEAEGEDVNSPVIRDVIVAPSFNTSFPPEVQSTQLYNGRHPGMVMDAARIYISQMTNIDENFKISEDLFDEDAQNVRLKKFDKKAVVPTSGIMLKADKIRMHSRQEIKIVTGGPNEKYNSQGNRIKQNNGIHLIAENGQDRDGRVLQQQPLVLGDNLINCLEAMCVLLAECVGQLDASIESQLRFNMIVSNQFHLVAPGAPSMPDPISQLQGCATAIEKIKERFYAFFQDINNFSHRIGYFNPISEKYILSRYNTTN